MIFEPIKEDLPLSFAYERPQFFRNKARENRWGAPVYFFPSTNGFDVLGCAGYGYLYDYPFQDDKSPLWNKTDDKGNYLLHYSNCTYVQGCFYHMRSGIILDCMKGSAFGVYARYNGRKTGGNFNGQYIGDAVQPGDMLIFADTDSSGKPSTTKDGHIASAETTDNDMIIMEGAFSRKPPYKDKACITYTIKKSDLYTGKRITLRGNTSYPYSEVLYGVIHTGDVFDKVEQPKEEDKTLLNKINKLAKEIVDLSK